MLIELTLQCPLFGHILWNAYLTLYSKLGCILSISWGKRAQIYLCRHPLWRHCRVFFRSIPTPLIVIFQTCSDDINFIVPPIRPYILERIFNALLETGLHFVNIVGKRGSNLPLSTPTLAAFSSFFGTTQTKRVRFFFQNLFLVRELRSCDSLSRRRLQLRQR